MNMVSQLRIYTINRGMMESWIKLFKDHIKPNHEKYGIPVEYRWGNSDQTEFIWVRSFDNIDIIESKEKEYYSSPERLAMADQPQKHIAKTEVRIVEPTGV